MEKQFYRLGGYSLRNNKSFKYFSLNVSDGLIG